MSGTTAPTVLIIEEDRQLRRLIGTILCGAGYRVLEARNRNRALDLLSSRAEPVDLVIVDSLCSHERLETGSKVLLLSCFPETCPEHGLLQKPFKPAALLDAVNKLLR